MRDSEQTGSPAVTGIIVTAVLVAVAARVVQFWAGPPFWVDESMMAANIAARGFSELLGPLDLGQVAPVGFLWLQRLALDLFGAADRPLRLFPALFGLLSLLLLWLLARRLCSRAAAAVVLVGAAMSPALLRNANELKPYAGDMAIALGLMLLALRILDEPARRGRWIAWGVAAVAAVGVSFPAALVVASAGVALVPAARAQRRLLLLVGFSGFAGMVSATVAFLVRSPETAAFMTEYWVNGFLRPDAPWRGLRRLISIAGSVVAGDGSPRSRSAMTFGVVSWMGLVLLANRGWQRAAIVVGPTVLAVVLALAGVYPIAARTWLFTVPAFLIGFGAAADWIGARIPVARWRVPVTLACAVVFAAPWVALLHPGRLTAARQDPLLPIHFMAESRAPRTEPVYVFARATPAWLWYQTDWEDPIARRRARAVLAARRPGSDLFHNRRWARAVTRAARRGSPLATPHGLELLGAPSGAVYRYRAATDVDPRWAAAEAGWISGLRHGCVWLFASNVAETEWQALADALEGNGWREGPASPGGESRASRYCRDGPVVAPPPS